MVETRGQAKGKEQPADAGSSQTPENEGDNNVILPTRSTEPAPPSIRSASASTRSSATIRAQKLSLQAEHARKLLEAERKVAELELEAQMASLEAEECGSQSRRTVESWIDNLPAATVPEHSHDVEPNAMCSSTKRNPTPEGRPENKKHRFGDGRLPLFDGKPMDWLKFKRIFEDTKLSFSSSDNLARISTALRGAAQDAVAVLLVSARDPAEVIEALEMRFGAPELIILQEIAAVRSLPKINNDMSDLRTFTCRVKNCTEVMRLLGERSYLESPELFQAILGKLTPLLRSRWADFADSNFSPEGCTKLELLGQFLCHEVGLQLKFGLISETSIQIKREKVHTASDDVHVTADATANSPSSANLGLQNTKIKKCLFCLHDVHNLQSCDKFLSVSVNDRWNFIKDNKICQKCLKKGSHSYRFCKPTKETCLQASCKSRHHKLLHNPENMVVAHTVESHMNTASSSHTHDSSIPAKQPVDVVITHTSTLPPTVENKPLTSRPFLKIIAVTVSGPCGSVNTYALLDDGSTATFIDSEICSQIGVKGPESEISLNCVSGLQKRSKIQYVDFKIKGCQRDESFLVQNARSICDLDLSRQTVLSSDISSFEYLADLADSLCYENAEPKVIIGVDNCHLTLARSTRQGTKAQPVAIETALGWVLFGFGSSRTKAVDYVNHTFLKSVSVDNNLDDFIKEQYKLDSIGITKHLPQSDDDKRAIQIIERTANRLPSGRFEVGLLWKSDNPTIPDSYSLALSRFHSLERKMARDDKYAEKYRQNIKDVLDKGYAEKCDKDCPPSSFCWYLPHFGVINPNKPEKLRVVHDAAAKSKGVSLNSLLLTGPDLLQSLFEILLRFREGKVAMTADIREMFPRFKIIENDRNAQRFLWRDSPNQPIGIYRMSSMIFGAVSSPFTAIYLKNKNALEVKDQFPNAVRAIVEDTYMDDYIGSIASVSEAAQLASEIVDVHARAGLEMRGWVSNCSDALRGIASHLVSETMTVDLGSTPSPPSCIRALGLLWNTSSDTIEFNSPLKNKMYALSEHPTKRDVLSLLMRVFDPLGFLMPLTIRGRILFQNAWRKNLDWDVPLPETEVTQWQDWLRDLLLSSQIKIPRCYNQSSLVPSEIELHVFADASEQAYAAVGYLRFLFPNGSIQLALIASKSRVAPLKPSSIPRLELQAALIASRLAASIVVAIRVKPSKRFFWTDSMNVLGWLRNDARNFKPFVAHRVGEIMELTNIKEWRWVPGHLNVADDGTRCKPGALTTESRWFTGPTFLLSVVDWPVEPSNHPPLLESKSHVENVVVCPISETHSPHPLSADPRRFSSWIRLVRSTARAHQYLSLLRVRVLKKKGVNVGVADKREGHIVTFDLPSSTSSCNRLPAPSTNTPTSVDLQLAEFHVLRRTQIETFAKELECFKIGQPVPRHSRLFKLPGFIDGCSLLRLSSRIVEATDIEEDVKYPILLDGKHSAVRLLVHHYHKKLAHANTETVVNELRQRFWILHLRNSIKTVIYNCQFCRLRRTVPYQPTMGNLPRARLAHHCRPFSFIGLNYMGPIIVTLGRRKEKRYVALYTCLTVRALHLEVVASLTSDAALMALRRFISRRGTPREIYSDNGTAFVGASRLLKSLYGQAVLDFSANEQIKWKFLPPSAPFMAGATERLVKSVKTALKVTLANRSPSDEVLTTLLCEAEALINSRPLTHISPDPGDPEALTPFHFILGSSSGRPIPATLSDSDLCSRAGWRKALRLSDKFWQRWMSEYLPTLSPRRLPGEAPSISIGDKVMIADGNLPRGNWPKGEVTAVFPGRDGVVRVADVSTRAGVFRRPLRKLVSLF